MVGSAPGTDVDRREVDLPVGEPVDVEHVAGGLVLDAFRDLSRDTSLPRRSCAADRGRIERSDPGPDGRRRVAGRRSLGTLVSFSIRNSRKGPFGRLLDQVDSRDRVCPEWGHEDRDGGWTAGTDGDEWSTTTSARGVTTDGRCGTGARGTATGFARDRSACTTRCSRLRASTCGRSSAMQRACNI